MENVGFVDVAIGNEDAREITRKRTRGSAKRVGRWKSWSAYLLTASQVVLDSFQTGIGELDEEQSFVFACPLLGHKAIVLVRRQTVLHPSSQSRHCEESS